MEEELQFTLGILKDEGFHVRWKEKYIAENNVPRRRVVNIFSFAVTRVLEPFAIRVIFIFWGLVDSFTYQSILLSAVSSHSETPRSNEIPSCFRIKSSFLLLQSLRNKLLARKCA